MGETLVARFFMLCVAVVVSYLKISSMFQDTGLFF